MPNKLPQGWVECKLEDVCSLDNGTKINNVDLPLLDVKYLRGKKEAEKIKQGVLLNKGEYIILVDGENSGEIFHINEQGIMGSTFKKLIFSKNTNIEFIKYKIKSKQKLFKLHKVGSAIPHLNKQLFKNLQLLLPPLNEQKRIVEKIESEFKKIDEGLEHLLKAKEQIKEYRQSVLKSAFEGKLYKTSEWLNTVLENIIDVNPKTDIPTIDLKDLVSFLPMPSVYAETNKYDEELIQYEKVKKGYTKFQNQDVLFAKITPCMENGKTCVVDNLKFGVGFGSTEFHVLRSLGTIIPKFIFYFVVQKSFRKQAQNVMTGAVGQRRVPADYLKNISINLPTLEEQKKIVEEIEKRFAVADEAEKVVEDSIEKAKQLKQSILKKAFEGRLVSQDPNDEPASKLLEKIKQERNKNDRK